MPWTDSKRLGPLEVVVLAAPVLWVVIAILHPGGVGDEPAPYEGIADEANKWILVHFSQLVLTPIIAVGVWMMVDGIQSVAATVARAFLIIWTVFFSAFDAIAGIAVGVLTRHANALAGEDGTPSSGQSTFSSGTAGSRAATTSPSWETWVRSVGSFSSSRRPWRSGGRALLALSWERPFSPCSSPPTPGTWLQSG